MKTPVVTERKLGRERAVGMVKNHGKRSEIVVDPRQTSYERLDTVIHEALHIANPTSSEDEIIRVSRIISSTVWKDGYRKEAQ